MDPPPTPDRKPTDNDDTTSYDIDFGGVFRGVAAATRKLLLVKHHTVKTAIRTVGQNRPLAFASEGAVAADSMLPRLVYYGAWSLSGVAIMADIYTKYDDAKEHHKVNTALYWTLFHVPASLVVPAMIIHQVVHTVEHAVEHRNYLSPRTKSLAPVAAALLSIIPVVPAVDAAAEAIMEPTLGEYLGLEFHHHHHHHHPQVESKDKKD